MGATQRVAPSTRETGLRPAMVFLAIRWMRLTMMALPATLMLYAGIAEAQTIEQAEESIYYLKQRACAQETAGVWNYAPDPANPQSCFSDLDCPGASTSCRHQSVVEPASTFYPPLEFPNPPRPAGQGAGLLRYVPLCEDGSGDHEYAVSGGTLGTAPTCASDAYIRCADGVRPFYRADAGTSNDWLIHAGAGGHASSPNSSVSAIWTLVHTQDAGSYTVSTTPSNRDQFGGIFNEMAPNPFSVYNRVRIQKCTPDRWLGNKAHHALQDFTSPLTLELVTGACFDADGTGTANCADNDHTPGACVCSTKELAPPPSPNNEYSVYYYGKRIVRAVLSDIVGGIATYGTYPLTDTNQDGNADIRPGDEAFSVPDASSKIVFHCHSNGCNGLQGGHIDDLHALIDAQMGADVDVRALFNGYFNGSVEAEITVTEYDGVDVNQNGVPDNDGDIDDSLSLYDHLIDTLSVTRQPMSNTAYEPQGRQFQMLADWWDASDQGYAPPVDASCLAHHCPNSALGWENDPACAPCNESMHVVLNHLSTPFLYNQAQFDRVLGKFMSHCETTDVPPTWQKCEVEGTVTGVKLRETHWRKLVRKMLADLYRSAELGREEGGAGSEWPYNHILLLAPDWAEHGPLSELSVATTMLGLPGAAGPQAMGALAYDFIHQSSPAAPRKAICLVERTPGENAFDFDDAQKGSVPACADSPMGVATEPDGPALPTGYALYQNYPNPFNPSTEIRFDLPQAAPVTLIVYDMIGRQVVRLVDAQRAAGSHRAVFDASGLPSGVYVYRIRAGSFTQTQFMVLLR